ncbi:hypothetical protein ACIRQQ_11815 [Streptomyces fuscichromogenes]|uniref:hypothetical protein n=1 Tax=Streptomyces fuscichromogenes TaxID=1324013 RepID=UPI0038114E06
MRRRYIGPALGALALVLVAAGCTTTTRRTTDRAAGTTPAARASATATACPGGTFRWTGVTREHRLTEVSPVVTVAEGDHRRITFHTGLVRDVVPRVDTSDPSVSAHRVLTALARHLELWEATQYAAPGEDSADRRLAPLVVGFLGHGGRYVEARSVQVVEGGFTVACPGGDVHGSVTTWVGGNSGATLACGHDPGDEAWVAEAYRLACGGGTT